MGLFKRKKKQEQIPVITDFTPANVPPARDTSKDVKLYRWKTASENIHKALAQGFDGGYGSLVKEDTGKDKFRYVCKFGGMDVGGVSEKELASLAVILGCSPYKMPDEIKCTVVLRDYDGKAWSACTVIPE